MVGGGWWVVAMVARFRHTIHHIAIIGNRYDKSKYFYVHL